MRVALYWAPELDDPLHEAGSRWLGRDAETGEPLAQPDLPGIAEWTEAPRLYGLHATLKPPFKLAHGWDTFLEDARRVAASIPGFDLPPLAVKTHKGFLALREAEPSQPLQDLADALVTRLDRHRTPASEKDLERRRKAGLTERQDRHLRDWGYPYVLEDFQFHVTLTRRLSDEEAARIRPEAEAHVSAVANRARRVRQVCVFTQREPDAPFLIAERLSLSA
ncbi:DUF1045 domain-containing protein [Sabulicella rubraurantiaca]|uniref:DUF1045 domain-containing protein n=1 Tax=Sabulicella rubraurantiaca TaxID=2811429 RepID=UPI001A977AA9|nr:DUF1045 domain-containing protein [Sabulicella rubraurantiaca]